MDITFVILTCMAFSFACVFCFKTLFSDRDKSEKAISIITVVLMLFLIICVLLGAKESIKYETMNDYFEGKIEIIEQIDTIRNFKFN